MTENKKIFTTPKVRKFARELGANISEIQGTERKGRILNINKLENNNGIK